MDNRDGVSFRDDGRESRFAPFWLVFWLVGISGMAACGNGSDSRILVPEETGGSAGVTGGGQAGASGGQAGAGGSSGNGGSSGGAGGVAGSGPSDGAAGTGRVDAGVRPEDGAVSETESGGTDGASADVARTDVSTDIGVVDVGISDVGGGDSDGATARPPCMSNASQVVVLGDSYINWISHTFPADLAREAGVTYRMYAVGAAAMGSGGVSLIPPQLDQAVMADPNIIAAVMDGGGNDILVPDTAQFPRGGECRNSLSSPTIPDCQTIVQKAVDAAVTLMTTAADKGIKDVVYFFYPHVPEGTLIGGTHPNAILDYALPLVKETCDGAYARTGGRLTCHFLDMIPVFENHPEYFAFTDIHPNPTGSAAMAKAVWSLMKSKCIAQPASSGCCTPTP